MNSLCHMCLGDVKQCIKVKYIVWLYGTEDNSKQQIHDKRGEKESTENSVEGETLVQSGERNWKLFLSVKANKTAICLLILSKETDWYTITPPHHLCIRYKPVISQYRTSRRKSKWNTPQPRLM